MSLIKCEECGKEISDQATNCPNCGYPVIVKSKLAGDNASSTSMGTSGTKISDLIAKQESEKPKKQVIVNKTKIYSTPRLVIGIISSVLFLIITFQSCAAGLANAISSTESTSGTAGFLLAVCMLIAGIVTMVLHKKDSKPSFIIPSCFYIFGALLGAANVGTFGDLKIWAVLSALFGALHLFYFFIVIETSKLVRFAVPIIILLFIIALPSDKNEESISATANSEIVEVNSEINSANETSQSDTTFSEEPQSSTVEKKETLESYEITYSNLDIYETSIGTIGYNAIVEIKNTGNVNLYLSGATFDIEDTSGQIESSETFISCDPSIIAPGENGYFYSNSSLNDNINPEHEYKLVPTLKVKQSKNDVIRFDISDTKMTTSQFGSLCIVGRITNNTKKDESMAWIAVVLYGENDIPLGAFGTNILDFAAGSTVGFEVDSLFGLNDVNIDDVARYEIYSSPIRYEY